MNTASSFSKYRIHDITADIIARAGLATEEAAELYMKLNSVCRAHPREREETEIWKELTESGALKPYYPHEVHQLVYYSVYSDWDVSTRGPPPYWFPSELNSKNTNLGRVMEAFCPKLLGSSYQDPIKSFLLFQKFSVEHPEVYYSIVIKELSLKFQVTPRRILDTSDKSKKGGNWFPGAVLNIAECCILPTNTTKKKDNDIAMAWRNEGSDDLPVKYMSYKEFRDQVRMAANALDMTFTKGDVIAIDMPMTVTAVIVYLAIVLAGYVVVTIADSFAANEIATRMRISKAKGIFTQDFIIRGGRKFPLYSRVIEACSCKAIVVPASEKEIEVQLRKQDLSWNDFISSTSSLTRPLDYFSVYQPSHATTNILFSSGTTGDPKAIPWTQLSPIKSASEAWAHIDMQSKDTFCWPTNLGWVMGPSVLYSAFLNGATLALFHGSPLDRSFGKFVQDARVTLLGTVPSMVKAWKSSKCMDGLDWSNIRAFATTGEASDIDDDLWLTSRSNYKPLFELCGGTELASSFVLGCFLQPQAYAAFSTPSMSTGFVILDKEGVPYSDDQPCTGEIALFPLLMGASDRLLNADHDKIYFHGMPLYKGMNLRRHGDIVQRTVGGYYIVHGRADDTMNLGGIKTSSVEIERVCNRADERVLETAAVSIKPITGGPEQLVVLVVLKPSSSSSDCEPNYLKTKFQKAIQKNLNPLFKVRAVKIVPEFPRTASNKLLRRVLRDQVGQEFLYQSKL